MSAPAKKKVRKEEPTAAAAASSPAESPADAATPASTMSVGQELIAKSTADVRHADRNDVAATSTHRKGHDPDQEVKSLAHIYSPWANIRANGSGIVALAAWAKRIEQDAAERASEGTEVATNFVRGLTHR